MCTAIRTISFAAFLDGQIDPRMGIPQLLVWLWTGKWQVRSFYLNLFLGVCVLQAVILGVGAMRHVAISKKMMGVFYPETRSCGTTFRVYS